MGASRPQWQEARHLLSAGGPPGAHTTENIEDFHLASGCGVPGANWEQHMEAFRADAFRADVKGSPAPAPRLPLAYPRGRGQEPGERFENPLSLRSTAHRGGAGSVSLACPVACKGVPCPKSVFLLEFK